MVIGNNTAPYKMFANLFCRWDKQAKMLRMGRLVYCGGSGPGTNRGGYSAKLSLAICPRILSWRFSRDDWEVTLLGVRLHHKKSHGGWIA